MLCCGVVCCGAHGVAWRGGVGCGVAWRGGDVAWCGVVRRRVATCDVLRCGVTVAVACCGVCCVVA